MASSAPQSALSSQPATSPPPGVRFVARQPILTAEEKVFGYELLFCDGVQNCFRHSDPDAAARSTLDSSLLLGLDVLCHGRYAFINCHRDLLLNDYYSAPGQADGARDPRNRGTRLHDTRCLQEPA